jgi:hypothetical protein
MVSSCVLFADVSAAPAMALASTVAVCSPVPFMAHSWGEALCGQREALFLIMLLAHAVFRWMDGR